MNAYGAEHARFGEQPSGANRRRALPVRPR